MLSGTGTLTFLPAEEIKEMSKTLQNLSSMSIHLADLTEMQYATKLREAESESEFGFSHLDLRLLHLGSSLFNGLTSVGAGFSMALIIVVEILFYLYCCQKPKTNYL
jgi:hypothetical protein